MPIKSQEIRSQEKKSREEKSEEKNLELWIMNFHLLEDFFSDNFLYKIIQKVLENKVSHW